MTGASQIGHRNGRRRAIARAIAKYTNGKPIPGPTTNFRPDIGVLRASPVRIVVGAGFTSKGQLANRAAVALATELGTDVVEFPGDHGGFLAHPDEFGHVLDQEQRAGASG